jgi:hypothetical protein
MFGGYKSSLAPDRFNRPLSALSLNTGYYKLPAGNYFPNENFTVAAWIKLRAYNDYSRLLDFGPNTGDDIGFLVAPNPNFGYNGNIDNWGGIVSASQPLPLNEWSHLSFTLNGTNLSIYVNASIWAIDTISSPSISNFYASNYLGQSNWYHGKFSLI